MSRSTAFSWFSSKRGCLSGLVLQLNERIRLLSPGVSVGVRVSADEESLDGENESQVAVVSSHCRLVSGQTESSVNCLAMIGGVRG